MGLNLFKKLWVQTTEIHKLAASSYFLKNNFDEEDFGILVTDHIIVIHMLICC
jgi:hypothetical protein